MTPRLERILAVFVAVVASWIGSYFFAARVDKEAYERAIARCEDGNTTVRAPLHDFLAAFVVDELGEDDDIELRKVAQEERDVTGPVKCFEEIEP